MNSQSQKIRLAQLIASSLSVNLQQPSSSIKSFLQKLYRKSLNDQSKINQIRLVRLNSLLSKIHTEFSQLESPDIEVLFTAIFCFLNKVWMFLKDRSIYVTYVERSRLLARTFYWVARLVQAAAETKNCVDKAMEVINVFLMNGRRQIPNLEQFMLMCEKTVYLKKATLGLEDQDIAGGQQVIIQERQLFQNILININFLKLIKGIVANNTNLLTSFQLFYRLTRNGYIKESRFKLFQQLFLINVKEEKRMTPSYLQILRLSLKKMRWDQNGSRIVEDKIRDAIKEMKEKLNVNQDGSHIMIVEQEKMTPQSCELDEMINHFVTSQKPTFKQLHSIIKQRASIPRTVLNYLQEKQHLTNAKGIIIALLITQSKKVTGHEFLKFCQNIEQLDEYKKILLMFFLHFSFQQPPLECALMSSILSNINEDQLKDLCTFSFLPQGNLQKAKLNKQEKTQIHELLTTSNTDITEQLFKVKIDLSFFAGENVPFFQTIDKIMSITQKSVGNMIESLTTEKNEDVVQVVLMRINYLMRKKYIEEVSEKVLDWVLKSYQTYFAKWVKVSKDYLSSNSKLANPQLAIVLKLYNLCVLGDNKELILPEIKSFFQQDPLLQLVQQQYSTYILHIQNKQSLEAQSKRYWNHIVELIKFIKSLDEKNYAKKEIRKIFDKHSLPSIYIVQGLHYAMKNNIRQKDLISKMLGLLDFSYEVFEAMEKKAGELEMEYYPIDNLFDYLLSVAYEDTVNFISNLLNSGKFTKEEKPIKKKRGKQSKKKIEENKQIARVLNNILSCLQMLLNQPNRLKDISKITEILDKLIHFVPPEEENELINCIGCWVSQFSTLTFNSFEDMMAKVISLREFFIMVYDFVKGVVETKEIEEQFSFFSNLLIKAKQYSAQKQYKLLEHEILSCLHLIFTLQDIKSESNERFIEPEKVFAIYDQYKKKTNQILYFFCQDCQKNVCEGCYTFLHRNHEVNFVSTGKGICIHEMHEKPQRPRFYDNAGNFDGRPRKPNQYISRFMANEDLEDFMRFENNDYSLDRAAFLSRMAKQKKERFWERAMERGIDINIPPSPYEQRDFGGFEFGGDLRAELGLRNPFTKENMMDQLQPVHPMGTTIMQTGMILPNANTRFEPLYPPVIKEAIVPKETKETVSPGLVQQAVDTFVELKSQTEKQIVEINTRQNIDIQKPIFECESRYAEDCPKSCINMSELLKQLLEEIPKAKLDGTEEAEDNLVHVLEKYNFEINPVFTSEIGQQKYMITRMGVSKFGGRYDLMDNDERSDRKLKMYSAGKLLIVSNNKFVAISLGPTITFLQEHTLKKCFKKKEKAKRYNESENQDSFRLGKKMDVPFEIIDMAFSATKVQSLGVLGTNQLNIINISITSREFKKMVLKLPIEAQNAVKFAWLPADFNKILVQFGTEIKLFEFKEQGPSPHLVILKRFVSAKKIECFRVRINTVSKMYTIFVTDVESSFITFNFNTTSDNVQETKLNIPQVKDTLNYFMISQKSNMGFASYKDGSNVLLKFYDNQKVQSINLKFSKYITSAHQVYNIVQRYGFSMTNVKQVSNSKDSTIFACILKKENTNNQLAGNLAIVEISNQNSVHLTVMNDAFKTENFEILNYQDDTKNKYLVVAVQSDGCIWMKSYQPRKVNGKQTMVDVIPEEKYETYHRNLIPFFKLECGQNRIIDFKEHARIHTLDATVNQLDKEFEILHKVPTFYTGITLKVEAVGKIKFKILNTIYQFNINRSRQLQIALTLKQSIQTFMDKKLKVEIIHTKKLSTLIDAFGHPYDKPSVIKDIYRQLIQLYAFNNSYTSTNVYHYFNDSSRLDFHNVAIDQFDLMFKQSNQDITEGNFVMKLQFLMQAILQSSESITRKQLEQFIDGTRKYMWVDKNYVGTSIQRMYKIVFKIYKRVVARETGQSIVYGDPYDYHTFKDTATVQHLYKQFLLSPCHSTFDMLVSYLTKLRIRRICNIYLMFALFPTLIGRLICYFSMQLQRAIVDISGKRKTGDRLVSMITIICEYFQYLKNQCKPGEIDTLKLFELLLSGISKNKEMFKELIMRAFEYLETVPLMKQLDFSYGCNLFEIKSETVEPLVKMEEEHYERISSHPIIEQQKQQQQDMAEMKPDEDYQLIAQSQPKPSTNLFPTRQFPTTPDPNIITSQCWKTLSQSRGITQITFHYFDIVYHLISGLFEHNIVKPQTNNFYIGMLYNLLNLLDLRIFKCEFKPNMIQIFMKLIKKEFMNKNLSGLFLVLSHFMEPGYNKWRNKEGGVETPKLRDLIVQYYSRHMDQLPFSMFYDVRLISQVEKTVKLKDALSSTQTIAPSLIYQLKYLGNLYLSLLSASIPLSRYHPQLKHFILKTFIKKNLRSYRNIIILEKWVPEINYTKFLVGFEDLTLGKEYRDVKRGLDKIMEGMKDKPEGGLVGFVRENGQKFDLIEGLLHEEDVDQEEKARVLEVIGEYYRRV